MLSGAVAGVVSATAMSPLDVMKSRLMVSGGGSVGALAAHMLRTEGAGAFFRGWGPSLGRVVGYNVVLQVMLGQVRHMAAATHPERGAGSREVKL